MTDTASDFYRNQCWDLSLPDAARADLEGCLKERRYGDKEYIYQAGQDGEEMFQIASGVVRLYALTTDGRELLYDFFRAGIWFGESTLIDGKPRAHNCQAVGEVTVKVLRLEDFQRLWTTYPEISLAISRVLTSRARQLYTLYEGISLTVLSKRMAGRLCTFAETLGEERDDGIHFPTRITQEDIGSLVVGSRQSVNQILRRWSSEGLIDVSYGNLIIRKIADLKKLAD